MTEPDQFMCFLCTGCGESYPSPDDIVNGLCHHCATVKRGVITETPRQTLERHLEGSYQPGVLINLLSVTLLAELDALNARLDGIEKRLPPLSESLPIVQEARMCRDCIFGHSPAKDQPFCATCIQHRDRPSFVKITTQTPARICPYCIHRHESRDKPPCSNGCWGVSARPNFVLSADANWK